MAHHCSICREDDAQNIVECPFCEFFACEKCILEWMETKRELDCANCGKTFTKRNAKDLLSSSAFDKFKRVVAASIIEIERAMMPATALRLAELDRIDRENIDLLKSKIELAASYRSTIDEFAKSLMIEYANSQCTETIIRSVATEWFKRRDTIYKYIDSINGRVWKLTATNVDLLNNIPMPLGFDDRVYKSSESVVMAYVEFNRIVSEIFNGFRGNDKWVPSTAMDDPVTSMEKDQIHCKCEACNGYVMGSNFECGSCKRKVCPNCFEERSPNHECDPTISESISVIKAECKPCPSCLVLIHRISGCAQMYCVNCKTPWNWAKGTVITDLRYFSNPHFVQPDSRSRIDQRGCDDMEIDVCDELDTPDYYRFEPLFRNDSKIFALVESMNRLRNWININGVPVDRFEWNLASREKSIGNAFVSPGKFEEEIVCHTMENEKRVEEIAAIDHLHKLMCASLNSLRYQGTTRQESPTDTTANVLADIRISIDHCNSELSKIWSAYSSIVWPKMESLKLLSINNQSLGYLYVQSNKNHVSATESIRRAVAYRESRGWNC